MPLPRIVSDTLPLALGLAILTAGCEDESVQALPVKGIFTPAVLDFGVVPVEVPKVLPTKLANMGFVSFEIEGVELPMNYSFDGLKASIEGTSIRDGGELPLDVRFYAAQPGEYNGQIIVRSGRAEIVLEVRARAEIIRQPSFTIEPAALNFGMVEVNTEARAGFTIKNTGNAAGSIDRAWLDSTNADVTGSDIYHLDTFLPVTIAEGAAQAMNAVFRPVVQGPKPDKLVFLTSTGARLELSLAGEGRIPAGDILCTPTQLDFRTVERGQSRSMDVTCTARGGPARLVNASISQPMGANGYFSLPSPPGTTDLQPNASVTIPVLYRPDGLPARHNGTLSVNYAGSGGSAVATVQLLGEVVPPPPTATAISVVLDWNTNDTDVDLHLVRPGAQPFRTPGDCYYQNRTPDWGTQGDMNDDPFLDIDDIDGRGPETINLSASAAGQYRVVVHYFSDHRHGPSTATARVYIAGNLAGSFMRSLNCDDLWTVGTVTWNGSGGTFAATNSVQPFSGEGLCF